MMIEIRGVSPHELSEILDLYNYLHATDLPLPDSDQVQSVWDEILHDTKIHYLVADLDGLLVGSCILTIIPNLTRGARPYGVIENVVTHPDHRRLGIGTQLLARALQISWEKGCYKVLLMTGSTDKAVHQFYEKAGFNKGVKTGFVAVATDGVVSGMKPAS